MVKRSTTIIHDTEQGKSRSGHRRDRLINLTLIIVSTVIAILIAEATLRLIGWKPEHVSQERARFWKYDELLGWVHEPGQEGIFEREQFHTTVRINQKGLRDREHAYEHPADTKRILVMGDSFAWGYGVEENQRFSEKLAALMDVEVINAGVSGYSTDQELIWFKNEGVKYDPDLVILVFSGNDIGDIHRKLVYTIYYKPQYSIEDGNLVLKGVPVPKTSLKDKTIYAMFQRSAIFFFLVNKYYDLLASNNNYKGSSDDGETQLSETSSASEPFKLTLTLLHEMRSTTESENAKFLIVTNDGWWNGPSGVTYTDFIDALHSEGFLVVDVETQPGFDPEKMIIPRDGHWNPAGHEFVAKHLKDFIESNQLLTAPQE